MQRRVAIAVPARDEADRIGRCLERLLGRAPDGRVTSLEVVVLANNCTDDTARIAGTFGPNCKAITLELEPDRAHAGWRDVSRSTPPRTDCARTPTC